MPRCENKKDTPIRLVRPPHLGVLGVCTISSQCVGQYEVGRGKGRAKCLETLRQLIYVDLVNKLGPWERPYS